MGFDVSKDYNSQERLHSRYNFGQILAGLSVWLLEEICSLNNILFFAPFTLSLISLVTGLFNSVNISKPFSSKGTNSETYLVCKGFKGICKKLLTKLFDIFDSYNTDKPSLNLDPIFDFTKLSNWSIFYDTIAEAQWEYLIIR